MSRRESPLPAAQPMPPQLETLQKRALAVGGAGALLCAVGVAFDSDQFFRSYLVAFLFWLGVGIGCQSVLLIHHLTGGLWGLVIRRFLEAGARVLRLSGLLFLPLVFGIPRLYPWANPGGIADHEVRELVERKHAYLNTGFFLGRAAFYFLVWALLAHGLDRWSAELDATGGDRRVARRLRGLSGGGLLLMGLTITFSAVDWAMSLDPTWFSTIYGILFMVGQALTAFSAVLVLVAALGRERPLSAVASAEAVHDLGKLFFAFIMVWGYVSVSQYLIVWSANLPEEITWYLRRSQGGWQWLAAFLVLFHFAAPFLILLSRDVKRNARLLGTVAAAMLFARLVDVYWLVGPELNKGALRVHWLDLAAFAGVGGLWTAAFAWQLRRRPLLPVGEPELREVLGKAHGWKEERT